MTVDRMKYSGLLIKGGLTTIKFFPTAHYAPSKSVAVASIADANARATPTHLLSQPANGYETKFSKLIR